MRQAVIYCRVDAPINGFTKTAISAQENMLRKYAHKNGISIKKYYKDVGCSVLDAGRPGIQELLRYTQSEPIDFVIVVNRSRLCRGTIPDTIKDLSKKIISLSEDNY